MRRIWPLLVVLALSFASLNFAWGGGFVSGPLVQVSGTSPYASCTADDLGEHPGTVTMNSEIEPRMAVNPIDPDNIVVVYWQDMWSTGGARGLVVSVSKDGGATWTSVVVPGHSICAGGIYERNFFPWVTFSPSGDLYLLSGSFNSLTPPFTLGVDYAIAVLVSKSVDGGETWIGPVTIWGSILPAVFSDTDSITADPINSNYAYASFTIYNVPQGERANVMADLRTMAVRGSIWFARTTNAGTSWEAPRKIFDPGQQADTGASQIVVLPDGTLLDVFGVEFFTKNAQGIRGTHVALLRSTDHGATWSAPIFVDRLLGRTYVVDPETGDRVRTGARWPDVAVDRHSGALYLVWGDTRFSDGAIDEILFTMSTDGGLTWTDPIKINQTPTGIPLGNRQAFTASVAVASDGTVGVTYYDFRNNTGAAPLLTDYFLVHCHADLVDCSNPASWGNEVRLTNTSFDMRQAPVRGGFTTGSRQGLTTAGAQFLSVFSMPHGGDPASIFFRRTGP